MDHVRHPSGAPEEAFGESATLVVVIPVETFGQHQALRRVETEAVNFGECYQEAGKLLALPKDAELGCLLDRVSGVLAGIGEADDFRLRALRLQQEGGEVRGVQRHANRADHLAASTGDDL